jgi:hypothetical protein
VDNNNKQQQQQQQQQQQLYEHMLIQMPHFHGLASGFKCPYFLLAGFSSKDKFLWFCLGTEHCHTL